MRCGRTFRPTFSTRVRGGPAQGVAGIELFEIGAGGARVLLKRVETNADGRTDVPLIAASEARVATFELVFHVGAYFRAAGAKTSRAAVPRHHSHSFRDRRSWQGALPRAPVGEPMELFDLSRQLARLAERTGKERCDERSPRSSRSRSRFPPERTAPLEAHEHRSHDHNHDDHHGGGHVHAPAQFGCRFHDRRRPQPQPRFS